jgi:hypothetical protein
MAAVPAYDQRRNAAEVAAGRRRRVGDRHIPIVDDHSPDAASEVATVSKSRHRRPFYYRLTFPPRHGIVVMTGRNS